ncbi:MAG: RodZ domain-containing protein [Thiohalomonadaceae bacterium]
MSETPHDQQQAEHSELAQTASLPGQRLRHTREQQGLSLHDVASNLRLSVKVITALEEDDYTGLPAATFVTGYLRAYARLLNIPESELNFPTRIAKEPKLMPSVATASQPSSRDLPVRFITALIVILLLGSTAYWWMVNGDALLIERAPTPAELADFSVGSPVSEPNDLSPEPVVDEAALIENEALTVDEPSSPPPPVVVNTEPLRMEAEIELRYQADSWTEISDSDGTQLAYGLIQAEQTLSLQGKAPFSIFLGYAPGVDVYFNDELFDHSPFQRRDVARFRLGGPEHNRPVSR